MRRERIASTVPWILSVLLVTGGCAETRRPAAEDEDRAATTADGSASTAAAHYLTAFAFTGAVSGSTRLLLEFVNRTSASSLARDYRGWIAVGETWTEFLDVRDTLPAPRAAWRILPGGGLQVRVGDGSRIIGLSHSDGTRRIRLRPNRILAEWTGSTGQRELLALAALETDSASQPGLLHFRRAARTAGGSADGGADGLLLLADARGDGLLVAHAEGDTAAFAWGWMDGVRSRWTDVELHRVEGEAGEAGWTLSIPSGGIAARLEAPPSDSTAPSGPGATLIRGTLETPGATRPVRGIALRSRLP